MPFAVPTLWREPSNHVDDCYFCTINVSGYSKKAKHKIKYRNLPSVSRPIPHGQNYPVPSAPSISSSSIPDTEIPFTPTLDNLSDQESRESSPFELPGTPHLINQCELNDLAKDLGLSKEKSELLGSRLQEWNLLARDVKVSSFRKRNEPFKPYFKMERSLCVCQDVDGLMNEIGIRHDPSELRLFIDASKYSLKAVLLHYGNIQPSILIAHSVVMKET